MSTSCYNYFMPCPECDTPLGVTVADDREDQGYKHIIEICAYCGYTRAFVDYLDDDTGEINWSGLDH